MKTIVVSSQRDEGHWLVIGEMPWPVRFVEVVVGPYCPRWGWDYRIWSAVLIWCSRWDRELVRIPIDHSCAVADKLWSRDVDTCYHGAP